MYKEKKQFIPITLRSDHLRVLVVGGGAVALRKIGSLLGKVREITVVAPRIHESIEKMDSVRIVARAYQKSDLIGIDLLYVAVDNRAVSDQIAEDVKEHKSMLCNFVDNHDKCDFYTPLVIQKGELILSLSSGGVAPGLLPKLKQEIEQNIDLDSWSNQVIQYGLKRRTGL